MTTAELIALLQKLDPSETLEVSVENTDGGIATDITPVVTAGLRGNPERVYVCLNQGVGT